MRDETPWPRETDDPGAGVSPRPEATTANADGFLALLLIALFLGFILSLTGPRRVTGDFLFESITMVILYSGSWLFAISGARRGTGDSRVATMTALALLVASVVLVLAVFIRSL